MGHELTPEMNRVFSGELDGEVPTGALNVLQTLTLTLTLLGANWRAQRAAEGGA